NAASSRWRAKRRSSSSSAGDLTRCRSRVTVRYSAVATMTGLRVVSELRYYPHMTRARRRYLGEKTRNRQDAEGAKKDTRVVSFLAPSASWRFALVQRSSAALASRV